jgi:hypothetical protein
MGNKRRWFYRSRHKDIKRDSSTTRQGQHPEPSPFVCGTCGYEGLDAYDLSTHLRDNNYCGNKKNSNVPAAAAARLDHSNISGYASRSTGDEESHPKEGDSFMYKSDDAGSENSNSASLGKPKAESSGGGGGGGGSDSSSTNDDDGDSSVISASGQCNLYDSADSSDEEHDSDTSQNGYEFYEETSFPTGVDDVVHVGLADLCAG